MLFNTVEFLIFFVIVYSLYLLLSFRWQNRMLLLASYIFYGWWDWRFLGLILISTAVDYYCGIKIEESAEEIRRKKYLALSVIVNLGLLGFFKYFNFFAESLQEAVSLFGWTIHPVTLRIVLPIGISFYTFQTMSYTIDIYRREIQPTRRFFDFALFVAFFPQLVAGPIERAKRLLPQILAPRTLSPAKFQEGAYLIFWGLYQKVFIADNLARMVDPVFASSGPYPGLLVLYTTYAFAFQIFCDFAGYSNIARGLGKMMGFEIMINFNLPYFATNPREFWQRWHISLSSWLRDYLYIPLGGNRRGRWQTYRSLLCTMLLGGLWHGAAWTFVFWGAYQGLLLMGHRVLRPFLELFKFARGSLSEKGWFVTRIFVFFHLVCLGWIFFRAENLLQAFEMFRSLLGIRMKAGMGVLTYSSEMLPTLIYYLWLLVFLQILCYRRHVHLAVWSLPVWAKSLIFIVMFYSLVAFGAPGGHEFIYFQF
ncbi:MAG: MBOAT family protein [Candidatus Omnitrophica bacterium]|nr:MBOAT family protein [Candidatus Omnitrophota bacterium]